MLDDYPVKLTLPILWGDQDAFGHVNNTACIRWFESARVAYLEHLGFERHFAPEQYGPILAQVTCNYRRQLNYPDTVTIGAAVTRIGNTSLTMNHAVWSETQEALAAEGTSVVVLFDYQAQQSVRLSDELRMRICEVEGRDDL